MSEFLWLLMVAGGPALLAILLFLAIRKRRRLTSGEASARHEAVEKLYDERR